MVAVASKVRYRVRGEGESVGVGWEKAAAAVRAAEGWVAAERVAEGWVAAERVGTSAEGKEEPAEGSKGL